jgi:pyrroloquinoline quinone biosynthesis protein D
VSPASGAAVIADERPQLAAWVRLQWDPRRQRHVLLAPEKVVVLNATGAAILALCDGQRTVAEIAVTVAAHFQHAVEADVHTFVSRLAARRLLELTRAA